MKRFATLACAALALGTAAAQEGADSFALGTLGARDGALPRDLWQGAEPEAVGALLRALPRSYAEPAFLDLARRVLLTPGAAPAGATNALAGDKLLAAAELGFYREAGELAELAPGLSGEPALSKVAALSALLDGEVREACARGAELTRGRADPFFLRLRFLCYVETGENAAADLTLGLLSNQDMLSEGDARVFTALLASGSLGAQVSPEDAFQYAAAAMLGAEVTPDAVPELPGAVLAAVARDAEAGPSLREAALIRALARGLIGAEEGSRLAGDLAGTTLADDAVAVAAVPARSPEQAAALAEALRGAGDWPGFRARAALFARQLTALPPDAPTAEDAGLIALGAMTVGADAAPRLAQVEDEALRARLSALAATEPGELPLEDRLAATPMDLGSLVQGALSAAASRSAGAAALAGLTGLGVAAEGQAEEARAALTAAMLARSGQADALARRVAFDAAGAEALASITGGAVAGREGQTGDPLPRLKPTP